MDYTYDFKDAARPFLGRHHYFAFKMEFIHHYLPYSAQGSNLCLQKKLLAQ
jgi:hypothetical protein